VICGYPKLNDGYKIARNKHEYRNTHYCLCARLH